MNQNLVKALYKFNVLNSLSIQTRQNGTVVPIKNGIGYVNMFGSEPWMVSILEKLLPFFPGAFLDIGANVGQTLIKVKHLRPDMDYIGFEPNPACVAYLKELIEANHYKNCQVLPVAISGQAGLIELNFYTEHSTDASASIVPDFRPEKVYRKEYIPAFSWSDLKIDTGKVGIVKIDVEGGEWDVIEGLRPLLERDRPAVLVEILPVYQPENKSRLERMRKLEALFRSIKYGAWRVKKENEQFISITPLKEIEIHGDLNNCEYLFKPLEVYDSSLYESSDVKPELSFTEKLKRKLRT